MTAINNFEDLNIWKNARTLVRDVYSITKMESFSKDYQLIDHIRKSAVSIPSNISEGFERDGTKEFINFLSIAKGSCGELLTQLFIAFDQEYIDKNQFAILNDKLIGLSKSISGLMRYLQSCNIKGNKFKT